MSDRFLRDIAAPPPPSDRPEPGDREGLPPSYRMRADAHYVEQLAARTPEMAVRFVPVADIEASGESAASASAAANLDALTRSITTHGVLQPLLVRRDGTRYRLIAGRHRLAAARAAGLASVPCVVHHADDGRAEQLADAERIHAGGGDGQARSAPGTPTPGLVLGHLARDLTAIESAATVLAARGLPTPQRVSVDMVRAQAWRASWLLQAHAVLSTPHAGDARLCLIGQMLERVRDGFLPESRLSGVDLQVCVPDWNISALVDESGLAAGVIGALVATFSLVEQSVDPVITLITGSDPGAPLSIDVAQDAAAVPAEYVSRVFDPSWTDRPGGWLAAVGAVTARAVAQRHGGDALFLVRERRGSTLRLNLARTR
jgi:hypothetical protein